MAFKIPESAGAKPENRFQFGGKDGKAFSLPFLQYLNGEAVEYLEAPNRGAVGEITFIKRLVTLADADAGAALEGLARDQIKAISEAWAQESAVTEGESSASDDS